MYCLCAFLVVCLQAGVFWNSASAALDTCSAGCTCNDAEGEDTTVSKVEGLAAAVGALTPMVLGGAGLGLYKLLKGAGPSVSSSEGGPDMPAPRNCLFKVLRKIGWPDQSLPTPEPH